MAEEGEISAIVCDNGSVRLEARSMHVHVATTLVHGEEEKPSSNSGQGCLRQPEGGLAHGLTRVVPSLLALPLQFSGDGESRVCPR